MPRKLFLTPLLVLLASTAALANEPATCKNNGKDTDLPYIQQLAKKLDFDNMAFASCRHSPNHVGMTYVTLITHSHADKKQSCTDNCFYDVAFLLTDTLSGEIKKQLVQKQAIHVEQSKITKVEVDTSPYQLSPSQRATGVKFYFEKKSENAYEQRTDFYMLIERDNAFRAGFGNVASPDDSELTKLVINNTLTRTGKNETCYRYKMVINHIIELGGYHNGFRDLTVKANIIDYTGTPKDKSCRETPIATTQGKTTIPFNGTVYFLPEWLSH